MNAPLPPGTSQGAVILDNRPLTPVEVELRIREITDSIERGALAIKRAHLAYKEAERALKREVAQVYLAHRDAGVSIKDADYRTAIDTDAAREERDLAEVAYTYAKDYARGLENQLRALQTQSASLRTAYPMAGRFDG